MNFKKKVIEYGIPVMSACAVLFLGVFTSGCGGGGGGGDSTPAAATVRPIATSTLRTYANGDNISYTVSGRIVTATVDTTYSGTSDSSITLDTSPLDPTGTVRSVRGSGLNITFADGSPVSSVAAAYFSQDATGTLLLYGNGSSGWITSPAAGYIIDIPSPIVAPSSFTVTATLQDGLIVSGQATVIGTETVVTGLGSMEAYKIKYNILRTATDGTSTVVSEFDYVVPSIGRVKMVADITYKDAAGNVTDTDHEELVIKSTNILY